MRAPAESDPLSGFFRLLFCSLALQLLLRHLNNVAVRPGMTSPARQPAANARILEK